MFKNMTKFAGVMIAIVLVGGLVLLIMQYIRYRYSPEYRVEKNLKEIEKQYAEDSYGGNTPEETLALFISALKAGDTDLAAKYFVLDAQEQWREDLAVMKEKELLGEMIKDLERKKYKYSISDGQIGFDIANDQNEIALTILVGRGPNTKWKIVDF